MQSRTILVVGASRGIGAALVKSLSEAGHTVIGAARSPAEHCRWIEADVATAAGIQALVDGVGHARLDTLIYAAGIWEAQGFTPDFDFFATDDRETRRIMAVNLIAPIEITKKLVPCLMQSDNPRALYLGAMSAVERAASAQVAYVASKYGLRGAIQALRTALASTGIGVTAIHPANVATDEVLQDIAEGRFAAQTPIPMVDIIATVRWLLSLSPDVDVGDVLLIQRNGRSIVAD